MDGIAVRNGKVSLRRGTNELVRIVRSDKTAPEADGRETVLNALDSRSGEIALEKPPQNEETDFANLLQRWRQLTGMVITGPRTDVSRHGTNVMSALLVPVGAPSVSEFPETLRREPGNSHPDLLHPTISSALTGEDGKFEISTYKSGDGVPEGEYVLTFMWGKMNLMSASYGGEDQLGGVHSDPKTSEVKTYVAVGVPIDDGKLELVTK